MTNSAPSEVLLTVPAVVFHLSKADEPEVKSLLNDHWSRPVSEGHISTHNGSAIYSNSRHAGANNELSIGLQLVEV